MENVTKRELTAPCGLDCFNCDIHESIITEGMRNHFAEKFQMNPEEVTCKGCRVEETGCKFLMQPCETVKCISEKNLEFCFECAEFPCVKLLPAKEGADRFPHNYKVYNLCRMKSVGVEKWMEEEADRVRKLYFTGKFVAGTGPVLE